VTNCYNLYPGIDKTILIGAKISTVASASASAATATATATTAAT
jgi:hypothetical protein